MRFIVVDAADARGSVAVFSDAELLFMEAHTSEEDYSSWLLPAVKRALFSCSLSLSQLDGYAVCAGPGSFTGLRVGLTTVKAWAEIHRKPIAAVSRLEALAVGGQHIHEQLVATFVDARRNQVFAALYERSVDGLALAGEEAVTRLEDFVARVEEESKGQAVRWVTPDAELLEALPDWGVRGAKGHVVERAAPPFALRLGQLAYRKFRKGETSDALSLDANYVRRSDAEVFWKGNKSAFKA
jgi:tRNA threonylcarbamoyladenosine biosynthesis protein TsaB